MQEPWHPDNFRLGSMQILQNRPAAYEPAHLSLNCCILSTAVGRKELNVKPPDNTVIQLKVLTPNTALNADGRKIQLFIL